MKSPRSKKSMVYETLKKRIINNSLKPGEPMNEAILAKELKISKTPIREALQQLERDGFVENISGRGAFVSRISFQDLKELFEIREILECEAIKRASLKCDLGRIEKLRKDFEDLKNNGDMSQGAETKMTEGSLTKTSLPSESQRLNTIYKQLRAGDEIHAYIFEALGNRRLSETYKRFLEHVERLRIHFFNETNYERYGYTNREHLEILEALAARDPARAESAVRSHLQNALEYFRSLI